MQILHKKEVKISRNKKSGLKIIKIITNMYYVFLIKEKLLGLNSIKYRIKRWGISWIKRCNKDEISNP